MWKELEQEEEQEKEEEEEEEEGDVQPAKPWASETLISVVGC